MKTKLCWPSLISVLLTGFALATAWVTLSQPALAATDVWTGQSGDNAWNTFATDWLVNGVPGKYTDGDVAILNDSSGPGHYTLALTGTLSPMSTTVTNSAGNYLFGGSGSLAAGSLTKLGSDSLTFNNSTANTFPGNTTVLQGSLVLNMNSLATPTNLLSSGSALVLGGGTLSVQGAATATSSQAFDGTTINSGASSISVSNGSGTGTTLALGTIGRNIGGTVDFTLPGIGGSITAVNANTNGILGGYATVGGANWAVSGGNGTVAGPISVLSTYTNDTWASGNNTTVTMSSSPAADSTTNSLRFNSNAGSFTVTLSDTGANSNTITSGGILVTSAVSGQNNTITGGLLTSGNSHDLTIIQNNPAGLLAIGSQIVNNGGTTIGLTTSGPGVVILSGLNTYTGITTINNGTLSVASLVTEGSGGGAASGIGQSGNGSGNLVLNGGTLQYTGSGGTTDRLLTLGPGGGALDASGAGAITFAGNGIGNANSIAFSQDTPATLTLQGSSSGANTFAPIIGDPDALHTYATSVIKNGAGTWILTNANTYTGSTAIDAGVLKANNTTGSATGTGPVTVNATGTLGGFGSVGGPVTFNANAVLAPGDASNFTINNSLTLKSGVDLSYDFNQPNTVGTAGGNDLTTVSGALNLNKRLDLSVTPGSSFGTGTYTLLHYGSLTDNSGGFNGWTVGLTSVPPSLPSGSYLNHSFTNDAANQNINLVESTSATRPPPLGPGQSTTTVQPANQAINNSAVNNPIVVINAPVNGGPNVNFNFFLARGAQPAAKAFNFGWVPIIGQLPPGTPYFVPSGVQVGDPAQTGIPISPNPPYTTNPPFNPAGAGKVTIAGIDVGAIYPAGSIPIAKAPDDWLPAFFVAPLVVFKDPPAAAAPAYLAESYINPQGLKGIFLADQVNGINELPSMLDSLSPGADDKFNYQGSFLSLVQSDFPGITDLSQLTAAQWAEFDGSFGLDAANNIAWSVSDIPNGNLTVVGVGTPEPSALILAAIGGLGLAVAICKQRRFRARL